MSLQKEHKEKQKKSLFRSVAETFTGPSHDGPPLTLADLQLRYRQFMSSIPPHFVGTENAKDYVKVIEEQREEFEVRAQMSLSEYQAFQQRVYERSCSFLASSGNKPPMKPKNSDDALDRLLSYCDGLRKKNSDLQRELFESQTQNTTSEQAIRNLKGDISRLNRNFEEKIFSIRNGHSRDFELLDEKHRRRLDAEVQSHQQTKDRLATEHNSTVVTMDRKYQNLENVFLDASDDFSPTPDKDFDNQMRALKSKIQKFALKQVSRRKELMDHIQDDHGWLKMPNRKQSEKPYLFEHHIWKVIHEETFRTPFHVLGEYGRNVVFPFWIESFARDTSLDPSPEWPEPSTTSERLRHCIMFTLWQNKFTESDTTIAQSYNQNIKNVASKIQNLTEIVGPAISLDEESVVLEISKLASELAFECSKQRCRVKTKSYQIEEVVSTKEVEDRNFGNQQTTGDDKSGRMIAVELLIGPGITREGDNRGGSWDSAPKRLHAADVFMKRVR